MMGLALNRVLETQRTGWVASLHLPTGEVVGIGSADVEMAFAPWYHDHALRPVEQEGAVVIIWRGGAPVQTIARATGEGVRR